MDNVSHRKISTPPKKLMYKHSKPLCQIGFMIFVGFQCAEGETALSGGSV